MTGAVASELQREISPSTSEDRLFDIPLYTCIDTCKVRKTVAVATRTLSTS